jgi:hypothetical protein
MWGAVAFRKRFWANQVAPNFVPHRNSLQLRKLNFNIGSTMVAITQFMLFRQPVTFSFTVRFYSLAEGIFLR